MFHVEHAISGILGRDAFPKRPLGRISTCIGISFACGPFGERSLPRVTALRLGQGRLSKASAVKE